MLRVLSSVAATLVFASALGAAPGNSTPESLKGAPGHTQETKPSHTAKAQVGKASWYGRIFTCYSWKVMLKGGLPRTGELWSSWLKGKGDVGAID